MCDCTRDFLERADSITGRMNGEPMSLKRIADNFALYGLNKRVAALESLDDELRDDIESGSHNLRRHVQLMALRRRMSDVHHALRKAKR
ncbi:hypothetical protein [Bradyrhizobium ivorense]|uniref:hypothetical protein n=1 Tax=Bradyrhizobium ivorense TaxID=2511166 RepID=UPI0010B44631|nr:hypothetical protein [Bradyrhizobium ivorense]VIO77393.1 hypothetical protein CI41S_56480 [Bradyrhizobium ivorense]